MSGQLETGVIYRGENLEWMRQFPDASVDLAYLDPPFFSNRQYEVIWGEEAEVRSFEDRWSGGIDVYVDWMRERMKEVRRLLKPTGSMWLHCDPAASHYLKVMLDQEFGREQFLSEVIWKRTGAHSSAKRPGPVHDVLLYYSRSQTYTWNQVYMATDPEYVRSKFTQRDADGRRFQPITLHATGTRRGPSGSPWRGINIEAKGGHWKYTPDRLDELDANGHIYWPRSSDGMPRLKQYVDQLKGTPLQDVWTDIAPVNAKARERIGYPTQKPIALLQRIIEISSNEGDVVLDVFAGCGTTIAAAADANRRWAGVDISRTACRLVAERLTALGVPVEVRGMDESEDSLRALKPFEFQNWVIERMHGTHAPRQTGDMGIDGFSFLLREPIQVKQIDRVDRPVVDGFETAVLRTGHKSAYLVAFSFTRGATAEVARVRREDGLDIRLVRVRDLLAEPDQRPRHVPAIARPVVRTRPPDATPSAAELVASERESLIVTAERLRDAYRRSVEEEEAASPEAPQLLPSSKHDRPVQRPSPESAG